MAGLTLVDNDLDHRLLLHPHHHLHRSESKLPISNQRRIPDVCLLAGYNVHSATSVVTYLLSAKPDLFYWPITL